MQLKEHFYLILKDSYLRCFAYKVIIVTFIVVSLAWHYVLKRPIYQMIYGVPSNEPLMTGQPDTIWDIPDQPVQNIRVNGFDIEIQLIKHFSTTTHIVYIDRYSGLGTWYRSVDGAKLYDSVVPLDLSFASGEAGENLGCYEFYHDYRYLYSKYLCSTEFDETKNISNNHTIPATDNIQRGLEILKAGDVAYIEGYLVYWQGTGKYQPYRFESAINLGQQSKFISNGQFATLCRQLYITKLTFDGYTFE